MAERAAVGRGDDARGRSVPGPPESGPAVVPSAGPTGPGPHVAHRSSDHRHPERPAGAGCDRDTDPAALAEADPAADL